MTVHLDGAPDKIATAETSKKLQESEVIPFLRSRYDGT